TFIRIYGDLDLLQRFRWSLLLGPVVPFCLSMALMAVAILNGHDLGDLLFLTVILTLWDPWHFLMQHYGFMRIYDRHNMVRLAVAAAVSMTAVYIGYVAWCYRNGYFVSSAKLALLAITFGVMYFTYVPNAAMQSWLPGWGFAVGYATVNMVHVTQYLAIV